MRHLRQAFEVEHDEKHLMDVVQTNPFPKWSYVEWLESKVENSNNTLDRDDIAYIAQLANDIEKITRIGSSVDIPEGSRCISISDTHAKIIVEMLRGIVSRCGPNQITTKGRKR